MSKIETRVIEKEKGIVQVSYFAQTRKLRRAAIKRAQGNNKISKTWHQQQAGRDKKLVYLYDQANSHGGQHRQSLLDQISRRCAR